MENKSLKEIIADLKKQQDELQLELSVAKTLEENKVEIFSVSFGNLLEIPVISPTHRYSYKFNLNGNTIISTITIEQQELIVSATSHLDIVSKKYELLKIKLIDSMVDEFRKFLNNQEFKVKVERA